MPEGNKSRVSGVGVELNYTENAGWLCCWRPELVDPSATGCFPDYSSLYALFTDAHAWQNICFRVSIVASPYRAHWWRSTLGNLNLIGIIRAWVDVYVSARPSKLITNAYLFSFQRINLLLLWSAISPRMTGSLLIEISAGNPYGSGRCLWTA